MTSRTALLLVTNTASLRGTNLIEKVGGREVTSRLQEEKRNSSTGARGGERGAGRAVGASLPLGSLLPRASAPRPGSARPTDLVRPGAGDAGEALHAAAQLHVLVRRVEVLEAVLDVRRHPGQRLAAEQHAGPAHAEVLVELERQQPELLLVPAPRLPDELRLRTPPATPQVTQE